MICHGDGDIVTDCELSKMFWRECGCDARDKTFKLYQGKGHLLYEEAPEIFEDSAQWIMLRVSEGQQGNLNQEEDTDQSDAPLLKIKE